MPLYEYKCLKCARHTDKIEPVAGLDPEPLSCKKLEINNLRMRLLVVSAIRNDPSEAWTNPVGRLNAAVAPPPSV